MNPEHITHDIAAGRGVIDEIFDAADRDEFSEDDLAKVDMLWRAVDALAQSAPDTAALDELAQFLYADPETFPGGADTCERLAVVLGKTGRTPANTETEERIEAAREWLRELGVEPAIVELYADEGVRVRVRDEYPGNTPGQDGWTSFCEDYAEGTLAATEPTA